MEVENCLHLEKNKFEPWAFEKVKSFEDIPHLEYWKETGNVTYKYISLRNLSGTSHAKYSSGTWSDFLVDLKHYTYEAPGQLLEHICTTEPIPTVAQVGEEYYIFDGNNRLCKARFLHLETFYCRVKEYIFNNYDFNLSNILSGAGFTFRYEPMKKRIFGGLCYNDQFFLLSDEVSIDDFVNCIANIKYTLFDHMLYGLNGDKSETTKKTFIVRKGWNECRRLKKRLFYLGFRGVF